MMCQFSQLITNHSISQALKAAPGDQFTLVTSQTALHSPRNRDVHGREGDDQDQDAAPQPTQPSAAACHCKKRALLQQQKETAKNQSQAILDGVRGMSTENQQLSFKKAWASALR